MSLLRRSSALAVLLLGCSAWGQDGGFTLFDDYDCPTAPPCERVDGGWVCSDARQTRIDCGLKGCQGEIDYWRPGGKPAETGFVWKEEHTWLVIIGHVATALALYFENRDMRHCRQLIGRC